jgi:hypothetical protein
MKSCAYPVRGQPAKAEMLARRHITQAAQFMLALLRGAEQAEQS